MINNTNMIKGDYLVGIGASAGGLEAIHELFDNIPDETGFSFIVVQHLSSDHKSLMGELLSKHTAMQIFEAEDGMLIKKNCIYLIPNKYMMTVKERRLQLHDKLRDHSPNNAIDVFFESLAADAGELAVGVVLSGTGTDGTRGIEAIKSHGGIVVVQDPLSAKFDGMPNSAVSSGNADLILPPEMIADELLEYISEAPLIRSFSEQHHKDEYIVTVILSLLKTNSGYDFKDYKKPTIYRRLAKRMGEVNVRTLPEYLIYLQNNSEEPKKLCQEFLIGVTKFFRDAEAFDELKHIVLPQIFATKHDNAPVKIWVAACSTGEEAYSLAILLQEYMDANGISGRNVKIFATDIDSIALEKASKGLYDEKILQDIPPHLLMRYFSREADRYKVNDAIRKMVVFAHHNVLVDPPFSKIDLVTCRNMLIYIGINQQKHILKSFNFALNIDGYLFLGPSENIGPLKDSFREVSRKWKIFQCADKVHPASLNLVSNPFEGSMYGKYSPAKKTKNALSFLPEIFSETIFEAENFAGIFIDKEFEVKQATGNFKKFIKFPEGNFNFNLLKLVPSALASPLSIAIRRAIKDNQRVIVDGIKVDDGGQVRQINIIVKPYLSQKDYSQPFVFIILGEQASVSKDAGQLSATADSSDVERFADLEKELNDTKDNLQALVEEVESANEELQTSNEEIISSNEELQSTNEELQSLNEELHTVNAEHQLKIKELVELNDDLNNYFHNADIGQIIVDKKLLIRKFSPAATRQINLIETDIGRSIIDISNNFKELDFINNVKAVLKSGKLLEKEVVMGNDTIFLMKLNPYLRADKSIDGVVISFIDITEVKRLDGILTAVFNTSASAIVAQKAIRNDNQEIIDFEYLAANTAANDLMKRAPGALIGRRMLEEFPDASRSNFQKYAQVVSSGTPIHFEVLTADHLWLDVVAAKMMDGVVITYTDITESKKTADALAQVYEEQEATLQKLHTTNEQLQISNMDLYQFASIASHDLKEPLRKIMAFGNILEEKIRDKINDQEKNYLDKIIKASGRMQNLIEDVLTFSRLSNTELPLQQTDLSKVLETVIDDLEIAISTRNAIINVGSMPVFFAVPAQMHQLFHNLISNALKFTQKDTPEININAVPIDQQTEAEHNIKAADFYAIRVTDNGIGFQPEFYEKIFKMFQRLNASAYSGTGIGLAICKKIVENHGGIIYAESELNKGASFTILLPKRAAAGN